MGTLLPHPTYLTPNLTRYQRQVICLTRTPSIKEHSFARMVKSMPMATKTIVPTFTISPRRHGPKKFLVTEIKVKIGAGA